MPLQIVISGPLLKNALEETFGTTLQAQVDPGSGGANSIIYRYHTGKSTNECLTRYTRGLEKSLANKESLMDKGRSLAGTYQCCGSGAFLLMID